MNLDAQDFIDHFNIYFIFINGSIVFTVLVRKLAANTKMNG